MDVLAPVVLIVGSILAISGLIVSRRPDAKVMIDRLTPYQATIGIAMLATGLWWLVKWIHWITSLLSSMGKNSVFAASILGVIACSIVLGLLFGMPQIAKWIPGDSPAEQKALELSQKVAPFQTIIGLVGLVASLLYLLFRFHVLSMTGIAS
jgi:hypothetical protein